MFEHCSFVALTTRDLDVARGFWSGMLGFRVTEEAHDHHFIVDAGGLRLCVDKEDGDVHRLGGGDPTIGLRVKSVDSTLVELSRRGLEEKVEPKRGRRGSYAVIHDPEGRAVILTEFD